MKGNQYFAATYNKRDVYKGVNIWTGKKTQNPVLYLYKGICKVHTFKNVVPKMYIFLWHFLTLNNAFEFNRLFITPTNNDINDIMIQKTVIAL